MLLVDGYVSVIAEVVYYDEDYIMIKNAARVVPQQNQNGQLMAALIPFIFGAKKDEWVKFPRNKLVLRRTSWSRITREPMAGLTSRSSRTFRLT